MRRFLLVVSIILCAGAAVLFWHHHLTASTPAAAQGQARAVAASVPQADIDAGSLAHDARALPEPNAITAAPLPPANTPLATMADELLRRANQGDTRAACRLGIELLRCRQATQLAESMGDGPPKNVEPGVLAMAQQVLDTVDGCAGVDPALRGKGGDWLHRAALAGATDAMLLYADGAGLDRSGPFAMLSDPALDTWRREAPVMIQRALQQGAPEAAWILWTGSGADTAPLHSLIPDDPVNAAAYQLLLSKLKPNMRPPDLTALAPAQRDQVQHRASEDFQRYFGAHALPSDRPLFRAWGALSPFSKESYAPCSE